MPNARQDIKLGLEPIRLSNSEISVQLIPLGARIVEIETKDRNGAKANIVLRYKDLNDYLCDKASFGAIVGRYANRIANGRFTLNGVDYSADVNDGRNSLHGGSQGFAQKVWAMTQAENRVEFTLQSPAGDMGFPGILTARCVYTLEGSTLRIDLYATTDADTVVNLTNHAYFNLSGGINPSILDYRIQIHSDAFAPSNDFQIPTGTFSPVEGTPMDFRTAQAIGSGIDTPNNRQLEIAGGYDQTWLLPPSGGALQKAARVEDPETGRTIVVETTQPGLHLYTGNSLKGDTTGPGGISHIRRSGLCLETQHFADSPNQPSFPSTLLRPGDQFHEITTFTFGISQA